MKKDATAKDNLIPFSAYPIRPAMLAGESIVGYVVRFCASNNVKVQKELNFLIRKLYLGREIISDVDKVGKIFGASNTIDIYGWVMLKFGFMRKKRIPAAWNPLTTNFMRYCPICMQQHGCHWYCWEMPLFVACPLHGCQLIQYCTTCNKRLIWSQLKADWSCGCSTSIKAMHVTMAAAWKVLVAKTITNATDCPSPLHYQPLLGECSTDISYTSKDIYDAMYWAHFLGRVLKIKNDYMPQRLRLKELEKIDYKQLGFREARFMFDQDCQIRRIIALFKKQTQSRQLINVIAPSTYFGRFLETIKDISSQSNPFLKQLEKNLTAFCEAYQMPIPDDTAIIFFTTRYKPSQRESILNGFADWWFGIANQIAPIPDGTEMYSNSRHRYLDPVFSLSSSNILNILNRLFEMSQTNESGPSLKRLILRWQVPHTLQEKIPSTEILNRLMTYFISISEEEIFYLRRLIQA